MRGNKVGGNMNFLLSDENYIDNEDLEIRNKLYKEFISLPKEFLAKMRHFQPQIGCFNNCGFCSKFSVCKSEYWDEKALRNVISALKCASSTYTSDDHLLAWDRKEHRVGVVFPYINSDVGAYLYLDKYIDLCYKELGVRTRISTVGFSRHNKKLNAMHKKINSSALIYALAGVRLSISQYGRVWEDGQALVSLEEYKKDLANFLQIYKPYFNTFGSGSRKMCVELRYNPLVENADVFNFDYEGKRILCTNNYLFVSKEKNIEFKESFITDPYIHSLKLSEKPIIFNEYNLPFKAEKKEQIIDYLKQSNKDFEKCVDVYLFSNKDGEYYAIEPQIKDDGCYGINIYPKTDIRTKSGYIVTERFLLNAIYKFKSKKGLKLRDKYKATSFDEVREVIDFCKKDINYYDIKGKIDKANYIRNHILPVLEVYVEALEQASYPATCFFDSKFTIDTGIICNLGRAIKYFKGLTKFINEPLTPTHERNYGRYCSTMKQENSAWLLSCGFDDNLIIEKLDLFNTASTQGQVAYKHNLRINHFNKKVKEGKEQYLYPGLLK